MTTRSPVPVRLVGCQQGISLIEVLIALLIVGFGLLAVALLQTSAIQNNSVSNHYTIAAVVAQSLSEAMRANRDGVTNGNYNIAAGTSPGNPGANCATATCSSPERAAWDLAGAVASITPAAAITGGPATPEGMLPAGRVSVACVDAPCGPQSPRVITVYWDGNRTGATGLGCNSSSGNDLRCFRLVHVP